jgi:RecA-family ATPase
MNNGPPDANGPLQTGRTREQNLGAAYRPPSKPQVEVDPLDRIRAEEMAQDWTDALDDAVVTSNQLRSLKLVPRKRLLGDWFCEGDLGFIFAYRGVGKTWFALAMAQALSTGGKLGDWLAIDPVKVLYVDGEMPADGMRDRSAGLQASNDNLEFLNHEILFDRTGRVLNITNALVQQALTKRCIETGVKVLVLDNLSTLASGMRENNADDWEMVNNWLLDLRRRKIAVVIVHHAGRSGEMRGTTKREDNVFWIVALDDAKKDSDDKRGARFVSRFTKPSRNAQQDPPAVQWHFVTEASGEVTIAHKKAQTLDVFRQLIEQGVKANSQIADEMRVSPGTVSKLATKAEKAGWLSTNKNREYVIIQFPPQT